MGEQIYSIDILKMAILYTRRVQIDDSRRRYIVCTGRALRNPLSKEYVISLVNLCLLVYEGPYAIDM